MTCSWSRPNDPAMTLAACADIVAKGDPDRFRAVMSVPLAARERLLPLYAFNVEVARAPWVTEEPLIAEMRLQWWRTLWTRSRRAGQSAGTRWSTRWLNWSAELGVPVAVLNDMIDARRWDIARDAFADWSAFDAHIDATSGGLLWAGATALGTPDYLEAPCRDAGFAIGVANWLVAVPALEAHGRLPLPDGRPEAVREQAKRGLVRLRTARGVDFGAAVPALRAGWQTAAILRRAERDPAAVVEGRLVPGPIRKSTSLLVKTMTGGW